MGRDVLVPLNALAQWALARREQVEAARRAYDAKARHPPLRFSTGVRAHRRVPPRQKMRLAAARMTAALESS
ncbi:hypothetical protein ACQKGO_00350 [Corallococcus interemptor]|uniref:hypothetical protein n=1 Tax=Corallococcus interemptor TaxID=2316720 RepID=UPI003D078FB5